MTRVVYLDEAGAITAEDAATGARGLDYLRSAKLARAQLEGRVLRVQGDRGITFLVSAMPAAR